MYSTYLFICSYIINKSSPTGGGRSVGIVRSRTKATELLYNKQVIIKYTRYKHKSMLPLLLHTYENNPSLLCGQPTAVHSFLYSTYALFMILQMPLVYFGPHICLRIYLKGQ